VLKDLEEAQARLAFLQQELEDIVKQQTVRMYEAIRLQKTEDSIESQAALSKQAQEFALRLQAVRKEIDEKVAAKLDKEKHELTASYLREREQALLKQKKKIEEDVGRELERVRAQAEQRRLREVAREAAQRGEVVEKLSAGVRALDDAFNNDARYRATSHQVHRITSAALSLATSLEQSESLSAEIELLKKAAPDDPLIGSVIETLPARALDSGIPTLMHLQDRFVRVSSAGRRAALVPPESGVWGQAVATIGYALKVYEKGFVQGDSPDARFARAEWYLQRGHLEGAVKEMEHLRGLPAEVTRDWLVAARERLVAEQALEVVKSEATLRSLSLT